jgi:hypothetical protein
MKITDVFERKAIRPKKGEPGPTQYRTSFKWSAKGGRMVSGHGETQEAADEACLEKIRNRFRGTYTPLCLRFRGETILIWRNGDQWSYGFIRDRAEPVGISLSGEWKSREGAERAARRHLAEIGWDEQEETSEILVHSDDQVWFRDWARSQKASLAKYRRLLEAGWTQDEVFQILWGFQPDPARIQQLGDPLQLVKEIERLFNPE